MPITESFIVDKKTKKIQDSFEPSREYWTGSKAGTIDLEIEVFASSHHKKVAKALYTALKTSGFLKKYPLFSVRIEPQDI